MSVTIGRVYVGMWDENDREIWSAANREVRADYLVTLDVAFGNVDPDLKAKYGEALKTLHASASAWHGISQLIWLFSIEKALPDVFNALLMAMGAELHSFAVVQLSNGEGIGYNAKERVVYEIYPGRG